MKLDLKSLYKTKIVPSMIKEFGYKNIEQVPKIVKISLTEVLEKLQKILKS